MGLKNTYQAKKRFTKVPVSKTGMWYQDGDVVVPSNQITMKGPQGQLDYFDSPIMGTGMQSGQTQVMQPGREYSFPNDNSVYETKMQGGGISGNSELALDFASMIPGPVGMVASGLGLFNDLYQGDWVGAGLNTANILTGGTSKGLMSVARLASNAGARNAANLLASGSRNLNRTSRVINNYTKPIDTSRNILRTPNYSTERGGYQDNTRVAPVVRPDWYNSQQWDKAMKSQMQNGGLFPVGPYDEMIAPKQGNYLLPDINRPYYIDDFGGIRSEYKMGFNDNGKETLIPTVVQGRQLTEDQAIDNYFRTGLNMGKYNSVDDAEYASKMRTAKYNMFQDPVRFQMQIGGETSTAENPERMNPVDIFTKGNKPESSDWFTKAIRTLIPLPANASQLIASSITGDDKYGWNDMNESSRYELMRSIENARKRTGKNKGGTEYVDYGKNIQQDINNLGVNGFDMVLGSLLSPEFKTATTLGRVSYEYNPNTKTYSVYDSYDFNSTNVDKGIYSKIRNTAGKIAPNKGKTHLIARYTEDDYNTYKNDFSKNRISYDDVSNFTNNAADKINNFPKNVANSVNEYVDPLIKSFKSNLPKMQDGAETSTADNPERMQGVNIQAPQRSWFDRNIERPLRKFGRSYAQRISDATGGSEWYKQANPFMNLAFEAMNAPQYTATYAATGKVQTPSEAMDIQNPYGAFAVDMLLDPIGAPATAKGLMNLGRNLPKKLMRSAEIPKTSFKSEIDWGKWNADTPKYPEIMNEYNTIEESTKKAGTWMKNPDGSPFVGSNPTKEELLQHGVDMTPEEAIKAQFIQQQSSFLKNYIKDSKLINPDGSPTIQYHGSAKKFDTFDESKFQLGDAGYSGSGIYTTPDKIKANSYSRSSTKFHSGKIDPTVYHLYGQANNPISSEQLIKEGDLDLFNFYRKSAPVDQQLLNYDAAIHNQLKNVERIRSWNDAFEVVFPTNKQLKSAVGNVGFFDANSNIYKAVAPVGVGLGAGASQLQEKKYGGLQTSYKKTKRFK